MDERDFLRLLTAYRNVQPSELAELFRQAPDQTRAGLERLLRENTAAFSAIVPQAIDQQTGLFTKEHFEKTLLPDAISTANEKGVPFSYVLLDIDNFHQFNRTYGHLRGDKAIYECAALLKKSFRTSERRADQRSAMKENAAGKDRRRYNVFDNITRLPDEESIESGRVGNGEEFALILHGCGEDASKTVADRFLQEVRKIIIPYKGGFIGFTVSGGTAQYLNGMTPSQLIENADAALLYSKSQGKDRITTFSQLS
ncbi:GGDEF domain-containing protein [Candidatus Woesearchaeota archaeon]|nr:GGDEF domain-containing protein [Candidatus Woesearchaeota archaeon]